MSSVKTAVLAIVTGFCMVSAAVAADITVRGAGMGKDAVSLERFAAAGEMGDLFKRTLQSDLVRSGWFRIDAAGQIEISGKAAASSGSLAVSSRVGWAGKYFDWNGTAGPDKGEVRRLAHRLADDIVRRVKGEAGIAATRIVFTNRRGPNNADLYMCDADGGHLQQITHFKVAAVGPKWDVDGQHVLYTSFVSGAPRIYRFPASGGRHMPLARFKGLNTGARVSPDGRAVALILSLDGNPELYTLNLATSGALRLTRTPHAVEASPAWSPDGTQIVYVCDASGSPQLYVVDVATKRSRRLTYRGTENVNPDWSPDGKIAYTTRRGGVYQIAVLDPASGQGEPETTLTSGPDHETPSWAADSRHIVCSRNDGTDRSSLWILDTQGDAPVRLFANQGNWLSPDWSLK
jgi:TolB protein